MKTVLIVHGIDGYAGIHWQEWLYMELEKNGYRVFMPELPNAHHPNREEWLHTVKNYATLIEPENLIVVGHSLGVASILDFLEIARGKIEGMVSVSGVAEDYGSELNSYFLKAKKINYTLVKQHIEKCVVFFGDNDPYVPQEVHKKLAENLSVTPIIIHNGGHLNTDAGFTTFPKLLEVIKQL